MNDRRTVLVLAGAAVALSAGLAIAWALVAQHRGETMPPPPASRAGLVIDSSGVAEARLDPTKPLRCFVAGQFVGDLSLADCAKRNGVATGALDVGLDETGALAATQNAGTMLTPLPPQPTQPVAAAPVTPNVAATDTCWSHSPGGWRELGDMSRGACVQMVFAGQCEGTGQALYARWGEQTLRLVTGRVEISGDNRRFQLLAPQSPNCSIGPVD